MYRKNNFWQTLLELGVCFPSKGFIKKLDGGIAGAGDYLTHRPAAVSPPLVSYPAFPDFCYRSKKTRYRKQSDTTQLVHPKHCSFHHIDPGNSMLTSRVSMATTTSYHECVMKARAFLIFHAHYGGYFYFPLLEMSNRPKEFIENSRSRSIVIHVKTYCDYFWYCSKGFFNKSGDIFC